MLGPTSRRRQAQWHSLSLAVLDRIAAYARMTAPSNMGPLTHLSPIRREHVICPAHYVNLPYFQVSPSRTWPNYLRKIFSYRCLIRLIFTTYSFSDPPY